MDVEYGAPVEDKNGLPLGKVDRIIIDTWSGKPRKYVIRLETAASAVFFSPENIASVTGEGVSLNLAADELERT